MNTRVAVLTILTSAEAGEWSTIGELRGRLGVPRRDVEDAIQALRLSGYPIVGGNEGLRYTDDPKELAAYLESRRRRTAEVHRGTMKMRSTLRRLMQQADAEAHLTLFGAP